MYFTILFTWLEHELYDTNEIWKRKLKKIFLPEYIHSSLISTIPNNLFMFFLLFISFFVIPSPTETVKRTIEVHVPRTVYSKHVSSLQFSYFLLPFSHCSTTTHTLAHAFSLFSFFISVILHHVVFDNFFLFLFFEHAYR